MINTFDIIDSNGICQYALLNGCDKLDCIGCEHCPHPAILEPEDNGICIFCERPVE